MSADQLIYPIGFNAHEDEWLNFDHLFQLPAGYTDSNPTSVESISPRDLDPSFTDADFLNWDSDPAVYPQSLFPETLGYAAPVEFEQPPLEACQSFINPNDVLQSAPLPSGTFLEPGFDSTCLPDAHGVGSLSSFRYMVESQAALDTRCFSQKEKRRDASIALHMQRLHDAPLPGFNVLPSDINLSSPNSSESSGDFSAYEPFCPTPVASLVSDSTQKSSPTSMSESRPGSMQLVLDLNMNTATNVPRKQRPRSKAQRENYIKARKYGVCEKHRKQHKRCNCLEKAATAHLNVTASCVGPGNASGLHTNHERVLIKASTAHSVQSPTSSATARQPSTLRQQPIRVKQDISPTLSVQQPVSSAGHERVTMQSSGLPVSPCGSSNTPALYRDKSQVKQRPNLRDGEEQQSRHVLRQSVHTQPLSGSRGALDVQTTKAVMAPLTECAAALARNTAAGLLSIWQGSTTLSSLAGIFICRFASFSSRLYMRSRKGMGLL
ncbi:hypothetical protein BJX61DRAFT_185390 [Aspergillus egyptiacus]|nr:hypothetical protein BJX61DRAFT_185390 [Aspergillus egyptiacus]